MLRNSPTGRHLLRGGQLRAAGDRPHPAMVVAWPGSGRSFAGVDLGGRRSSGELGVDATVAGEARAGPLCALVAREGS